MAKKIAKERARSGTRSKASRQTKKKPGRASNPPKKKVVRPRMTTTTPKGRGNKKAAGS